MKPPAFQFYPRDFLVGVAGMSDDEIGCYIRMLCFQWDKDGLPCDPVLLQRMLGRTEPVPAGVMAKFTCQDGILRNERLEMEREKQNAYRASRKQAADARWKKQKKSGDSRLETAAKANASPGRAAKQDAQAAAERILDHINTLCGRGFRRVEANLKPIRARLAEPGVTEEAVLRMLDHRWSAWRGGDMEAYFCPETLFRPSKFEKYFAQSQATTPSSTGRTLEQEIAMLEGRA